MKSYSGYSKQYFDTFTFRLLQKLIVLSITYICTCVVYFECDFFFFFCANFSHSSDLSCLHLELYMANTFDKILNTLSFNSRTKNYKESFQPIAQI